MEIRVTSHARYRMLELGISDSMLTKTLNYPDNVEYVNNDRKAFLKRLDNKVLRVIVEEYKDIKVVVTLIKAEGDRYGV